MCQQIRFNNYSILVKLALIKLKQSNDIQDTNTIRIQFQMNKFNISFFFF